LRQLVAGARTRLAELEAEYTKEKSRVDATQAVLFRQLREPYQKRDRLRLIVEYRKKYLDSLLRGGDAEAKQAEARYEEAKAQSDWEYDETAAIVAQQKRLTAAEEVELSQLWRKLVKLYHPDRFAHEPEKLATYARLTAAINRAKDSGDIATLREIAEDPHGFILRKGWTSLDFRDDAQIVQLRRLYETLQIEIITVIEALDQLRESPDYELCQLSAKQPGLLDRLAAERAVILAQEAADLERQASLLAEEMKGLDGEADTRIR
jgi:DNA polymerase-3 subunit epsilon